MRNPVVVPFVLLILLGIAVSRVKYEVSVLRKTLQSINMEIEKGNDQLRVLRAEWCHLTNPERLKILAAKYLPDMGPANPKNIITYDQLLHDSYPVKKRSNKLSQLVIGEKK